MKANNIKLHNKKCVSLLAVLQDVPKSFFFHNSSFDISVCFLQLQQGLREKSSKVGGTA